MGANAKRRCIDQVGRDIVAPCARNTHTDAAAILSRTTNNRSNNKIVTIGMISNLLTIVESAMYPTLQAACQSGLGARILNSFQILGIPHR